MSEGTVFSLFVSSHLDWGGSTHPLMGGILPPFPGPGRAGGTPFPGGGVPLPKSRWGYPHHTQGVPPSVPPSQVQVGYPLPRSRQGRGYPLPRWGGTPSQVQVGVPPSHTGGTPCQQDGVPLTWTWEGGLDLGMWYPHPGQVPGWGGTPNQNSIVCTCYVASGMPLALTQEDFLFPAREKICCIFYSSLLRGGANYAKRHMSAPC